MWKPGALTTATRKPMSNYQLKYEIKNSGFTLG